MTTTRTSSSAVNAEMISGIASHMSCETALRFSGWLNVIQPTPSSTCASMRSVCSLSFFIIYAPASSDDAVFVEFPDALFVIPQFSEDFVRVLALLRCCSADRGRGAAHLDRLVDDLKRAKPRVFNRDSHLKVPHLRVCKHLVHRVDRPARAARLIQEVYPVLAWFLAGDLRDCRVHLGPVARTQFRRRETLISDQMGSVDRLTETLVDRLTGDGD